MHYASSMNMIANNNNAATARSEYFKLGQQPHMFHRSMIFHHSGFVRLSCAEVCDDSPISHWIRRSTACWAYSPHPVEHSYEWSNHEGRNVSCNTSDVHTYVLQFCVSEWLLHSLGCYLPCLWALWVVYQQDGAGPPSLLCVVEMVARVSGVF